MSKTATSRSSRTRLTGLDEAVREALAALKDLPAWVLAGTEMEAIVAREEKRLQGLRVSQPSLVDRSARRLTAPNSHPASASGTSRNAQGIRAVGSAVSDASHPQL
jgi:hypothetical protein